MVIAFIFDLIKVLFNKTRRGVLKTSVISTAVKSASLAFFLDEVEKYTNSNQDVIPKSLQKFITISTINLSNGIGSLPSNFVKAITFESLFGHEGEVLQPEEFDDRKRSLILTPTSEQPILKVMNNKVYVEPASLSQIFLTHIRTPNDFVYGVTTDGDGRGETFNSGTSTDTEFGLEYANEIVKRSCLILGIGYQNPDIAPLVNEGNK